MAGALRDPVGPGGGYAAGSDPVASRLFGQSGPVARALRAFLDLMFPARCEACGADLSGAPNHFICRECFQLIRRIGDPACRRCGAPIDKDLRYDRADGCPRCRGNPMECSEVVAAAAYDPPLRDIILAFKFGGGLHVGELLSELLVCRIIETGLAAGCAAIVPVPVTRATFRRRGFNQAEELARAVGRRLGIPVRTGWLEKSRETPPQATLPAAERRRNLRGAFRVPDPRAVRGAMILLVDDVTTTGATLSECAAVLLAAGATGVRGAAVARTPDMRYPDIHVCPDQTGPKDVGAGADVSGTNPPGSAGEGAGGGAGGA
ncbi:MAG: ComF family protein [Planctomycetota bacterium]|nr:ComF family protein [Planctomycetota bacterium]